MGYAATEDRLRQVGAPGDSQPAIAAERPLPFLRDVHVDIGWIGVDSGNNLPLALQRDRNREDRNRAQKIRRPIERVDVPGVTLVGAIDPPALFHHEAIPGARLGELIVEYLFRTLVGEADKITGALHRYLQLADFAKVALQTPPSLDRGVGHHCHQGGADHGWRPWRDKSRR